MLQSTRRETLIERIYREVTGRKIPEAVRNILLRKGKGRPRKVNQTLADVFQLVIEGLKKEVARLEKIAARFEKSHSIHHDSVRKIIASIEREIKRLESGRI